MTTTPETLVEWGRKAKQRVLMYGPAELSNWGVFSKTLGFFQWKKKMGLTESDVEHFKRGWDEA